MALVLPTGCGGPNLFPEDLDPPNASPERLLRAAVLSRAFWDLNYISTTKEHTRSAIKWFRKKPKRRVVPFSFQWIKLANEYPDDAFVCLARAIKEADQFLGDFREKTPSAKEKREYAARMGHYFSDPEIRRMGNFM